MLQPVELTIINYKWHFELIENTSAFFKGICKYLQKGVFLTRNYLNKFYDCFAEATAKIYEPPLNGALVCLESRGKMCAVFCRKGVDFIFNPPLIYYDSGAAWNFYAFPGQPFERTLPWPDCSSEYHSIEIIRYLLFYCLMPCKLLAFWSWTLIYKSWSDTWAWYEWRTFRRNVYSMLLFIYFTHLFICVCVIEFGFLLFLHRTSNSVLVAESVLRSLLFWGWLRGPECSRQN